METRFEYLDQPNAKQAPGAPPEVTEVSYLKSCNRNSIPVNRLAQRCARESPSCAAGAVCRLPLRQK
jgi:hypothetical protein